MGRISDIHIRDGGQGRQGTESRGRIRVIHGQRRPDRHAVERTEMGAEFGRESMFTTKRMPLRVASLKGWRCEMELLLSRRKRGERGVEGTCSAVEMLRRPGRDMVSRVAVGRGYQ